MWCGGEGGACRGWGGGSYLHYSLPSQDGGGGEVTALEGEFLGRQSLVVGDVTTAAIVQQRADDLQHVTWENQASKRAQSSGAV